MEKTSKIPELRYSTAKAYLSYQRGLNHSLKDTPETILSTWTSFEVNSRLQFAKYIRNTHIIRSSLTDSDLKDWASLKVIYGTYQFLNGKTCN